LAPAQDAAGAREAADMKTVYTEKHRLRAPAREFFRGDLVEPFERAERAEFIVQRIGSVAPGTLVAHQEFGMEPVRAIHDDGYLAFLESCWRDWRASGRTGDAIAVCWPTRRLDSGHIPDDIGGRLGYYGMATDTSICEGTWEASLASKDVALTALQHVLDGDRAAFALCRPPGHHAAVDQFCGYCFLNNAAIAAERARRNGVRRVAILDVDFHHGNGTQSLFYDRSDVLCLSIHGHPKDIFPYFLGYADETGSGDGEGFNRNYPLPPGTAYPEWRRALDDALERVAAFGADLLIVPLGVDTFEGDPISFFKLRSEDFSDIGARLAGARLPTVFVMEGGYAIEQVGVNVVNVLTGFEEA
jgi:acetoin utilization deacetylase AcuC-like enzyme